MIENCIGKISLPLGLGLNFLINKLEYVVPMAVEEPSIIAAVSGTAKLIKEKGGGFSTWSSEPLMIGQIQILEVDPAVASKAIMNKKDLIIGTIQVTLAEANSFIPRMVNRGGGVISINCKIVDFSQKEDKLALAKETLMRSSMLVVELVINVCDSMGANVVNTVCEKIAPTFHSISGGRIGLRIMSNLCIHRRAGARFHLPCSALDSEKVSGEAHCKLIMEAFLFATGDPFRAATHNKGIMNGISAVAVATGQDWRAIEAAAHSFASLGGYQPLTRYAITKDSSGKTNFEGSIEMPVSVGTRGGAIHSNPLYIQNLSLLKNPSSSQLAEIMMSVGLAQNFAALKALSLEGIQKGHMKLHARNIAISAGIPLDHIEEAVKYLVDSKDISVDKARQFILNNKGRLGSIF
jgi:degradative hydroxymethylglutaryl-CoA reductase